jgi:hypothetical protein
MDRKWINHNPLRINVFRFSQDTKPSSGKIDIHEPLDARDRDAGRALIQGLSAFRTPRENVILSATHEFFESNGGSDATLH